MDLFSGLQHFCTIFSPRKKKIELAKLVSIRTSTLSETSIFQLKRFKPRRIILRIIIVLSHYQCLVLISIYSINSIRTNHLVHDYKRVSIDDCYCSLMIEDVTKAILFTSLETVIRIRGQCKSCGVDWSVFSARYRRQRGVTVSARDNLNKTKVIVTL